MPALPVHHTATVDGTWDGPAAVAAMPNDDAVLRYCHAWISPEAAAEKPAKDDDDADDQKGSYKFPHHRTKGGPANVAACRNGLARLSSASIPSGDDAGVRAHLQAHLADAEKGSSNDMDGRILGYGRMGAQERVRAHLPRVQRFSNRTDWFKITDATATAPARLDVYDEIGFFGVSAGAFSAQLGAVSGDRLEVHVNSPGGDVFDGLAILNLLRAHPAAIDVVVDGLAASAASFVAMAGDSVTMMPNSQLMIHDAAMLCVGNASDMAACADLLNLVSDNIASIYAGRTGAAADTWRAAMRAETWYSADEAVAAGLADRVADLPQRQAAAAAAWNLSFYAYDGRASAPAPPIPARTEPVREPDTTAPAVVIDPDMFNRAMREAAQ